MISDRDVWTAALLMVKRYGDDAMLEAAGRADELLDAGDTAGAEVWHRILNAIERLQAKIVGTGAEGGSSRRGLTGRESRNAEAGTQAAPSPAS